MLNRAICSLVSAIGSAIVTVGPEALSQRGSIPSLQVSPANGGLGSVITISVVPQTPGYELSSSSVLEWAGVYDAPIGADSALFSASYVGSDFVLLDSWTAQVLIGGGQINQAPNIDSLVPGGSLVGTFTTTTPPLCIGDGNSDYMVDFDDITAMLANWGVNYGVGQTGPGDANHDGVVDFADQNDILANYGAVCSPAVVEGTASISLSSTSLAQWRPVLYPDGVGGLSPPEVGAPATSVLIHRNSLYANPSAPPVEQLWNSVSSQYAVVLRVEENAVSTQQAPATISVDLVSLDAAGIEIDREQDVVLTRLDSDGDPQFIMYGSNPARPVIVIDQSVNQADYPEFYLIYGTLTGKVGVRP